MRRRAVSMGGTFLKNSPEDMWKYVKKIESGCWEWQSSLKPNGYGEFTVNYKVHLTHRLSWELSFGPVPNGLYVLHECDNRKCVKELRKIMLMMQ